MGTLRKLLIGTVILGSLAGVAGSGTFASFNATTTNAGTFDTATLTLTTDQDADATSTCISTGGATNFTNGNNNTSCTETLLTTNASRVPGASDQSAFKVKITNGGDIAATGVKFWISTACATTNDAGTVHGPTAVAGGTGDLCAGLKIAIQETGANPTWTDSACRYDADNSGVSCDLTTAPTVYTTSTSLASVATAQTLTGSLAAGASRYFKVMIAFPSGASGNENQYMGKKADFAIGWLLEQ